MGVRRLKAAMQAGADVAFMESPRTKDEMRVLVKELAPHPVLINVLPDVSFRAYRVPSCADTIQGLTGNLTTAECNELGFAAAIYPCTGFIPSMLAMQDSYQGLKNEGSDLKYCKGNTIVHFFEQLGLKDAMDFDDKIEQWSKNEVEGESKQDEA